PAVEDSGWSYEKKGYSFRGEVVLTYKFKNYQAYKMIHGIQFPELPMLAKSRAQAPGYIMSGVLSYIGLTSGDVEIIKIDGLEGSRGLSAD
ncbi:MAG: hypothetical protein Q8K26_02680, partial [Candidatus Gracilibacteria bacterium]|nr:hypothetical protein [Candidatus Gracilibacteria bacterium]